jgi:hypothetical protein
VTVYDPDIAPAPERWLALDETDRIDLVTRYHERLRVKVLNLRLHAMIHTVVENQAAIGEAAVVETLARLRREGLTRHDALHAVGGVLIEQMQSLLGEDEESATVDVSDRYAAALRTLTAEGWRAGG